MSESFDCIQCGACCAAFRVDFSIHETESMGGPVPDGLCAAITDRLVRMNGTDHSPPRCAALSGRVGQSVRCGIYEWRPSPCREFAAHSPACVQVRRRQGLMASDEAS